MANDVNTPDALSTYGTTVYPSTARTATPDSQEYEIPRDCLGLWVTVDVTSIVSGGTLTIKVEGVDRASGKTWPIITSAALATVQTVTLRAGQSLTPVANLTVNDMVPTVVRITATQGGTAGSQTYSIGLMLS